MRLNGTHNLPANPQQIWNLLMDADVLAKITPGVSRLEPLGGNRYTAVSEVKLGPVKGTFTGEMEVANMEEPKRFTLLMKQNSKIGNVNAEGQIILNPMSATETEVEFSGEAKLSGTLSRTGQRVLTGVANSMTNQFFQSLEAEIKERYPATEPAPEPEIEPDSAAMPVIAEPNDFTTAVNDLKVAIPATTNVDISTTETIEKREPQIIKDTVQRDLQTEIGPWQRLMNWIGNLFK